MSFTHSIENVGFVSKHGIFYCLFAMMAYSDMKSRKYKQEYEDLLVQHQALYDDFHQHLEAIYQHCEDGMMVIDDITEKLCLVRANGTYNPALMKEIQDQSDKINDCFATLDDDSKDMEHKLIRHLKHVEIMGRKVKATYRQNRFVYNTIATSWAGLTGLMAASSSSLVDSNRKATAYTILSALIGSTVLNIYQKATRYKKGALELLHDAMIQHTHFLDDKCSETFDHIHEVYLESGYHKHSATRVFNYFNLPTHQVNVMEVYVDRLLGDTDHMRSRLLNTRIAVNGTLAEVEEMLHIAIFKLEL